MHGVRLQPDSTVIELLVRLFNRTERAADLPVVGQRRRRGACRLPVLLPLRRDGGRRSCQARASAPSRPPTAPTTASTTRPAQLDTRADSSPVPGDRFDWPRNIPVPTSYMASVPTEDFFGGYDHRADAGFVHWADHHVARQEAMDLGRRRLRARLVGNLTDDGATYIELMAGVYTDNQPDFSHLAPGRPRRSPSTGIPWPEPGRPSPPTSMSRSASRSGRPDHAPVRRHPCPRPDRPDRARPRRPAPPRTACRPEPPTRRLRAGRVHRHRSAAISRSSCGIGDRDPGDSAGAHRDRIDDEDGAGAVRPAREPAAPGKDRLGRGAVSDRAASGAVPARHPFTRAVLVRGAVPRSGPCADPHRLGGPALPRRPATRGRTASARGRRSADRAQPEPDGRRGALPARA